MNSDICRKLERNSLSVVMICVSKLTSSIPGKAGCRTIIISGTGSERGQRTRIRGLIHVIVLAVFVSSAVSIGGLKAAEYKKPVTIGVLTDGWGATWETVGLRDGLKELGYRENQDFMIGVRFTEGDTRALPKAASDLVKHGADILFTGGRSTAQAAHSVTKKIPIVFAGGGDPVGLGLVKSFARPGGNVTGVTELDLELAPKRLEFFKELIPRLNRVLFLYNATDSYGAQEMQAHRKAARELKITLLGKAVRSEDQVKAALARVKSDDVDGILSTRPVSLNIPGSVLEAGSQYKIPTIFASPFFVENGGLASYSPHSYESGRMAARLVDKIIKGESPSEIPVEANPKIELLINLKTAKVLGIQIPPEVLYQANRIIR